jgi:hypothetical protein
MIKRQFKDNNIEREREREGTEGDGTALWS